MKLKSKSKNMQRKKENSLIYLHVFEYLIHQAFMAHTGASQ